MTTTETETYEDTWAIVDTSDPEQTELFTGSWEACQAEWAEMGEDDLLRVRPARR